MKDPTDLKNYKDLLLYLRACLAYEGQESWPDIASRILGVLVNDQSDTWCHDRRYPEIFQLIEIAADMEASEVYGLREEDWQALKAFTELFAKKLEIWPRLKTIRDVVEYLDVCLKCRWLRQDDIAPSILALNANVHFTQLLKSGKYPELIEIMKVAAEIETGSPGMKNDGFDKIRTLVPRLTAIYGN